MKVAILFIILYVMSDMLVYKYIRHIDKKERKRIEKMEKEHFESLEKVVEKNDNNLWVNLYI